MTNTNANTEIQFDFLSKSSETIYILANVWQIQIQIQKYNFIFLANLAKQFISQLMYESAPLHYRQLLFGGSSPLWQIKKATATWSL